MGDEWSWTIAEVQAAPEKALAYIRKVEAQVANLERVLVALAVQSERVIEIDEDGHVSHPTIINEGGRLRLKRRDEAPAAAVERTPHQRDAVLADRVERYLKDEKESSHKRLVRDLVHEIAKLDRWRQEYVTWLDATVPAAATLQKDNQQ